MEVYNAPLGAGVGKVPTKDLIKRKKELTDDIYALRLLKEQCTDITPPEFTSHMPGVEEQMKEKTVELKRVKRAISAIREKESRLKNKK